MLKSRSKVARPALAALALAAVAHAAAADTTRTQDDRAWRPPAGDGRRAACTAAQRAAAARFVPKQPGRGRSDYSCPKASWLDDVAAHAPAACSTETAYVLVVGGNKGYDCVGWLRFFGREHDWRPSGRAWADLLPSKVKGVCAQGGEEYPVPARQLSRQAPRVVCVEPLPANYEALAAAAAQGRWASSGLEVVHAAALLDVAATPTVPFPNAGEEFGGEFGKENVGIATHQRRSHANDVLVKATTVDELVFGAAPSRGHRPHVPTILSIDTEGFDAFVLMGAARTLATGGVELLEFEYHSYLPWGGYKLEWIIAFLDNLQYDCYWAGNDGHTTKITGCWHANFEFHDWSNVVCAHRVHARDCWHYALERALKA